MSRIVYGIIPARAGFTCGAHAHDRQQEDHPRSRGVYGAVEELAPDPVGSSPLARGLLQERGLEVEDPGIIPARAGFTPYHS